MKSFASKLTTEKLLTGGSNLPNDSGFEAVNAS